MMNYAATLATAMRKLTAGAQRKELSGNLFASFVCLSYAVTSLTLVFLNFSLFTDRFRYPIFITWSQQVLGTCMYGALYVLYPSFLRNQLKMREIPMSLSYLKTFIPLTLSFAGMVAFANLCLKFALISTYQTARCLTIFWTLLFSYLLLGAKFPLKIIAACSIQACGFLIGSLDVSTLTKAGSFFGCMSSICQGTYNVNVKKCLPLVSDNTFTLLVINLALSSIFFFPLVFLFGEGEAFSMLPLNAFTASFWKIWIPILCSGLLATLLNLMTYAVIQVTSPVTFNIVGVLKSCLQTAIGLFLLKDPVSFKSMIGITLTITGSALYGYFRISQPTPTEKPKGYVAPEGLSDDSDKEECPASVLEVKAN